MQKGGRAATKNRRQDSDLHSTDYSFWDGWEIANSFSYALLKTMEHSTFPVLIPQHLFPQNPLLHQEYGWWYIPTAEIEYRTCPTCKKRTSKAHFHTRGEDPQATCTSCPKSLRAHHARHSESSTKRAKHRQIEQGQNPNEDIHHRL
jgi:hypothetical protein